MIAFHFPPCAGSSGLQRTLRFVQHLPSLGWEPVVLSAHRIAYARTSDDLMPQIPPQTKVLRPFALDTARHLSVAGRYPGFLARPDRWQSWRLPAVASALHLARRLRVDALWSTYPIATAHSIAASVHRHTRLPWVADFRDPMAQDGYPADPLIWQSFAAIEQRTLPVAARSVFTTPSAAEMYRQRFPLLAPERIAVIENGYDEEAFAQAERDAPEAPPAPDHTITLLHSGIVYPSERDPSQLMKALAVLKAQHVIGAGRFCVRFRASEHEDLLQRLAAEAGVSDLIQIAPPLPYNDALKEMLQVDGLLLLQASNCNEQIPAKLYEYLRARKPIVALTDATGDTAKSLARCGISAIAPLDDADGIARLVTRFVADPRSRGPWLATEQAVLQASRRSRASDLARLLEAVSSEPARSTQATAHSAAG